MTTSWFSRMGFHTMPLFLKCFFKEFVYVALVVIIHRIKNICCTEKKWLSALGRFSQFWLYKHKQDVEYKSLINLLHIHGYTWKKPNIGDSFEKKNSTCGDEITSFWIFFFLFCRNLAS